MNIQDYALHASKQIKESFDNGSRVAIEQWQDARIFDIQTTTEVLEEFTSTEGVTGAKKLAELETPGVVSLDEGYTVQLVHERFGEAIVISEQMQVESRDNTTKILTYLERQRNRALIDLKNLFTTRIHLMLNEAFSSTSAYLSPDGVELCGTHTWNSGGTFVNATTAAFSETAVDAAMEYAGAFTDAAGVPMPLNFDTIIVKKGSAVAKAAKQLFAFGISPVTVATVNIYEGEMTIIETPYITTAAKAYWFLRDSSLENSLYVGITEMPSAKAPIIQDNQSVRTNLTGFWKQGVRNMPFDIYGGNGTA